MKNIKKSPYEEDLPPPYWDEMLDRLQSLTQEGRYQTALDEIFPLLDDNPNDKWVLELATLVVHSGQGRVKSYNAIEPLIEDYLIDPRLDALFCECDSCMSFWVPNPLSKHMAYVSNAPGGKCPKCGNIFCRQCSIVISGDTYNCPKCRVALDIITDPNGRTPRQTKRRKEKLELVLIYREGPVPPDDEYLVKWLCRLSPDVFDENPQMKIYPTFPWPNKRDLIRQAVTAGSVIKGKFPDLNYVDDFSAFDEEGNNIYLMKFFEESTG